MNVFLTGAVSTPVCSYRPQSQFQRPRRLMERCAPTGRAPCWPALDEQSSSTATGEAKWWTRSITAVLTCMSLLKVVKPDWWFQLINLQLLLPPFCPCRDFHNFSLSRGMLDSAGRASTPGSSLAPDARRSLCEFGLDDGERRGAAMEYRTCRAAGSSSATNIAALTSAVEEFQRQPPDSPTPGGDVRRKVFLQQEEGDGVGDGLRADGGGRKKGVLDGSFLGRKRAPPAPHLSSGSEGGSSDSSSNASPSPTKLTSSTSPRQRKLAPELPSQDSSLWQRGSIISNWTQTPFRIWKFSSAGYNWTPQPPTPKTAYDISSFNHRFYSSLKVTQPPSPLSTNS